MNRFSKSIFALVLFFWWILLAQSAEQPKKIEPAPTGAFQVNVSDGYLSLVANQAPLVQVFEEIGKQARITIQTNIGPEEKITKHLDRVPLEDGIRQLGKNVSVFYAQDANTKARHIVRVVVLSEVKGTARASPAKPASQPEKKVNDSTKEATKADKPQPTESDPTKPATNQTGVTQP
jgi:hypothetical protein